MTLTTDIRIIDPTPPEPLFRFCRELVAGPSPARWYRTPGRLGNVSGQGCVSMLKLDHAVDGPLTDPYPEDREEMGEPPMVAHSIAIMLDTIYGYRATNGASCEDLHAWIVREVGGWCERRGLRYEWVLEYSGAIYYAAADASLLGDPEMGAWRDTPDENDLPPLPMELLDPDPITV